MHAASPASLSRRSPCLPRSPVIESALGLPLVATHAPTHSVCAPARDGVTPRPPRATCLLPLCHQHYPAQRLDNHAKVDDAESEDGADPDAADERHDGGDEKEHGPGHPHGGRC